MKKIMLLFCVFLAVSCNNKKHETQVAEMQNVIDSLSFEISMYKNSPEKLFVSAEEFYTNEDIDGLRNVRFELKTYAIDSEEYKRANELVELLENKISERIAKAEKEKKDSIAKIEKEKMLSVSKMKKEYDDVTGITWYKPRSFVHYNNSNLVSLYIGKSESTTWMNLLMSYSGDDWIFFEAAYLSYDGNTHVISFDKYSDKKSDNSGGGVWEWINVSVEDDDLKFLKEMVKGKSLKMRLSGKYTNTRNLSWKEINEMKNALLAYEVLKEK